MTQVVKPVSITSLFTSPRTLYMEMMRKRLNSEIKGVLTLMRFYRQHHSDIILSSGAANSADAIIDSYIGASITLHNATTLSQVREVHQRVMQLNERYSSPLESVFFSMALIHGYND